MQTLQLLNLLEEKIKQLGYDPAFVGITKSKQFIFIDLEFYGEEGKLNRFRKELSENEFDHFGSHDIWINYIFDKIKPCKGELKQFYITLASSHGGSGYILVHAESIGEAREKMFQKYGEKWAFSYNSLDEVHPNDRIQLGEIA